MFLFSCCCFCCCFCSFVCFSLFLCLESVSLLAWRSVVQLGQAISEASQQKDIDSIHFCSPLSSIALLHGRRLRPCPSPINVILKWLTPLAILTQSRCGVDSVALGMIWKGCSSAGRASDRHAAEAGSIPRIPRCGKGFFSQSQL